MHTTDVPIAAPAVHDRLAARDPVAEALAVDGPVVDDPIGHRATATTTVATTSAGRHVPSTAIDRRSDRRIKAGSSRAIAMTAACRSGSTRAAWRR